MLEIWSTVAAIVRTYKNHISHDCYASWHVPGSGNYGDAITLKTLKDFHRRRVQVLADAGADLLAFETIPNKIEAQVF